MNPQEIQTTAELLQKLEPGFLPNPIFQQVTRVSTTAIVEIVPLRRGPKGTQILLMQRPSDDPAWPNQWHTPGTVIRATDATYQTAINRVLHDELTLTDVIKPVFVMPILHQSGRGQESSVVYCLELQAEPPVGTWFDAKSLPPNIVTSQLDFIPAAIHHFESL